MSNDIDIDAINAILASESDCMLTDTQLGRRPLSGSSISDEHKKIIGKANSVSRTRTAWTEARKAAAAAVCAKRMEERNALRAAGVAVQVISEQGRMNIGLSAKGRKQSPEALKKRSESMKRTLALKRGTAA